MGHARALIGLWLFFLTLGAYVGWPSAQADAADRRQILIIYSWDDLLPWQSGVRQGLQEALEKVPVRDRPNVYEERLDAARIKVPVADEALDRYLREKYATVRFDAIIAESSNATTFLLRHPDLFAGVDRFSVNTADRQGEARSPRDRVFVTHDDPGRAMATILRVMPEVKRIVAIVDNAAYGETQKSKIRDALPSLPKNIEVELWDQFSFDELYQRAGHLPEHSAIYHTPVFRDRTGAAQIPRDVAQQLGKLANVPIFSHHDTFLGTGIVGGYMISSHLNGELIARIALGQPVTGGLDALNTSAMGNFFDDAQLKRWNIPDSRLPEPYTIINRPESVWRLYGWQVASVLGALVLEGLLILWLLLVIRQRRQAVRDLALERDGLERRVAERTTELAAASAAKSNFLANMSHEVRNPLNAILGLAQVLEGDVAHAERRDLAHRIREAGAVLLRTLNDVLDLSKIEAGKLDIDRQPFRFADLISNVRQITDEMAQKKGLVLRVDAGPCDSLQLCGDVVRVEQILLNLLSNAIKFTSGGEIVLGVRVAACASDSVRLRFEVRDCGIGIPAAKLTTLFKPFTQVDIGITRRFGGTGLGLSISKRLVDLMGGVIGVESIEGVGSSFWFELPFDLVSGLEPDQGSKAAKPTALAEGRLMGLRVLAVDDSPMNLDVVERLLKRDGASVMLAGNGEQALRILREQRADVDVVLMDIQMPIMDGLTATREIRKDPRLSHLPVIALSAGVMAEERDDAKSAGINDFLAKPVDLKQMRSVLASYVTSPVAGA